MPSIVSIVETRPETVRSDYGRLLDLAGMVPAEIAENTHWPYLLPQVSGPSFQPGFDSTPWQVDAVLDILPDAKVDGFGQRILPIGKSGPDVSSGLDQRPAFRGVLGRRGAALVSPATIQPEPLRVASPLPSLQAVLPGGIMGPRVLEGRPLWLLPVPELNGTWQLAGSVALIHRLLAGKTRKVAHIPRAEVIAEALALARSFMGPLLTVMDATAWGIHRQDGQPHAMVRHVLLAGDDPVAVDAVAAKLAGVDPRMMSWLQLCQDRGLGMASLDKIVIKGRKDLLSLDFQMPKGTFGTGPSAGSIWAWPGRLLGALGRKNKDTTFGNSAWGRLLVDYEQEK